MKTIFIIMNVICFSITFASSSYHQSKNQPPSEVNRIEIERLNPFEGYPKTDTISVNSLRKTSVTNKSEGQNKNGLETQKIYHVEGHAEIDSAAFISLKKTPVIDISEGQTKAKEETQKVYHVEGHAEIDSAAINSLMKKLDINKIEGYTEDKKEMQKVLYIEGQLEEEDSSKQKKTIDTNIKNSNLNTETYTIYSAGWDSETDIDGDGYTRYRKLYFDVDVSSGTHTVYAKIYYKLYTSSSYSLYLTTNDFTITENSSSDEYWIAVGAPNPELSHNIYDFEIRVYKSGSSTVQATRGPSEDSDLNDENFETTSEDGGGSKKHNCLYVVSTADQNIISILNELQFHVSTSNSIPADLTSYDLVICREYSACTPTTATYVGNFVKNGGGAILMRGTPSTFGGGGYSCSNIADWFGTGQYSNVGVSDARVVIDYPLGTSLVSNDVIDHCSGWGGAAVKNVAADVTVLAMWDYGDGNIHSFIRSHQNGRVAFWAGDVSYNEKNRELFTALCRWVANATTLIENQKLTTLPEGYHLFQNYPNPFNPNTTISYALPQPAHVQVEIFDVNGQEVKRLVDQVCSAGVHSVVWNGTDEAQRKVPSGIYICRLSAGEVVLQRKLILTK